MPSMKPSHLPASSFDSRAAAGRGTTTARPTTRTIAACVTGRASLMRVYGMLPDTGAGCMVDVELEADPRLISCGAGRARHGETILVIIALAVRSEPAAFHGASLAVDTPPP